MSCTVKARTAIVIPATIDTTSRPRTPILVTDVGCTMTGVVDNIENNAAALVMKLL